MRILFYLKSRFGDAVRDPDYPEKHPMGGSETAVVRLAQVLRARGHEVEIAIKASECFRTDFDVWISMRDWGIFAQECHPAPLRYLWCQDDADQPFLQPLRDEQIANFIFDQCAAVVFPSKYAAQQWQKNLHLTPEKSHVIPNGIPAELFQPGDLNSRPLHVYYSSTPQRGLKELIESWPKILEKVPAAKLFVASSMRTYQLEDDDSLKNLFRELEKLPQTNYLGALNQSELRKVAQSCRVWAYPCTFAETGCIAAMEAMAAGCVVVSNVRGALPEIAEGNPLVSLEGDWLKNWTEQVCRILSNESEYLTLARQNIERAQQMSWERRADQWLERIEHDTAIFERDSHR